MTQISPDISNTDSRHSSQSHVPTFPWLEGLSPDSLSTIRGFVFQFPPFPTLRPLSEQSDVAATAGLYVHIPFCKYRCSFCYHAVSLKSGRSETEAYLDAIGREIDLQLSDRRIPDYRIRTVFFGGGTPTALTSEQLQTLASVLRRRFDLSEMVEFSVESDPTTLTYDIASTLREIGANRLSIGVQTFSTEINELNSRRHTVEESYGALQTARKAGFDNINIDLICGLVGETESSWEKTIDALLATNIEHVTIYLFSFRPQTGTSAAILGERVPMPADEETRIKMYQHARSRLLNAGYHQTTANCFIRQPEFEQIHQREVWSSQPMLGFGNSAYAFTNNTVTQNFSPLGTYMKKVLAGESPIELRRDLNPRELMVRYAVLRFKQLFLARSEFTRLFGFDIGDVLGRELSELYELGLISMSPDIVSLTERGIVYVDDVCRAIYTPSVKAELARLDELQAPKLRKSLI